MYVILLQILAKFYLFNSFNLFCQVSCRLLTGIFATDNTLSGIGISCLLLFCCSYLTINQTQASQSLFFQFLIRISLWALIPLSIYWKLDPELPLPTFTMKKCNKENKYLQKYWYSSDWARQPDEKSIPSSCNKIMFCK